MSAVLEAPRLSLELRRCRLAGFLGQARSCYRERDFGNGFLMANAFELVVISVLCSLGVVSWLNSKGSFRLRGLGQSRLGAGFREGLWYKMTGDLDIQLVSMKGSGLKSRCSSGHSQVWPLRY